MSLIDQLNEAAMRVDRAGPLELAGAVRQLCNISAAILRDHENRIVRAEAGVKALAQMVNDQGVRLTKLEHRFGRDHGEL